MSFYQGTKIKLLLSHLCHKHNQSSDRSTNNTAYKDLIVLVLYHLTIPGYYTISTKPFKISKYHGILPLQLHFNILRDFA